MHRELQPNDERPAAKPWSTRNIGRLLADRSHLPARRQRGGVPRSVRFSRPSLVLGRPRDHRQVLYWLDQFDLDAQPLGQQRGFLDSLLPVVGHYRGDESLVAIGLAQDDGERVLPLVMRHAGRPFPGRKLASIALLSPALRGNRDVSRRSLFCFATDRQVFCRAPDVFRETPHYCVYAMERADEAVPGSVTSWVPPARAGAQQHG